MCHKLKEKCSDLRCLSKTSDTSAPLLTLPSITPTNNHAYMEGGVGAARQKGQTNRAKTDSPDIYVMVEVTKTQSPAGFLTAYNSCIVLYDKRAQSEC